jgi:hypothetical protein
MSVKILPSRNYVHQLLDYDPESGLFTWRPRSRDMFGDLRKQAAWNARYALKHAGCITSDGYRIINIHCSLYMAHRLAWLLVHGEPVPPVLDHVDQDRLNNRITNLREATHTQNFANSGARKNSKLGIKGVWRHQGKYRARIETNRKIIDLGTFDVADDAALAYRKAATVLHGEFAYGDDR